MKTSLAIRGHPLGDNGEAFTKIAAAINDSS